ncbi:unannotated protein [freshwater metagenome]|uniref:Unannotated protein n=1 Tax=freshwater metagenome TaxID=449393 RepID=A0A6J6IRL9_9ZZZZ
MILNFPLINSRYAANIATVTLAGGSAATVLYNSLGLNCPMQSIGLACPGCGCGRAAIAFVADGPMAAIQAQPTALLFLMSIVVLAVVGRTMWITTKRWRSYLVVLLPLHLAFGNLVFQLIRAGAN